MVKSPETGRELPPTKGYKGPPWLTRLVERVEGRLGIEWDEE